MKTLIMTLLLFSLNANAEWYKQSEGDGTAFEKRWISSYPIRKSSSPNIRGMFAFVYDGGLAIWTDPGLCTHDNWKLAIDKNVFVVAKTSPSVSGKSTFLDVAALDNIRFVKAFRTGSSLAVQFNSSGEDCDKRTVTLVFSLSGSESALNWFLGIGE